MNPIELSLYVTRYSGSIARVTPLGMSHIDEVISAVFLMPSQPDIYDRRNGFLAADAWIFKVKQQFSMLPLRNPIAVIFDKICIRSASPHSNSTVTFWWFDAATSGAVLKIWVEYISAVRSEFVFLGNAKTVKNNLQQLWQKPFVYRYLPETRNKVWTISGLSDYEEMNCLEDCLKQQLCAEVVNGPVKRFEGHALLAFTKDSAVWRPGERSSSGW